MYTQNLKPRIVIGPCSHEFWPASGWVNLRSEVWSKFYFCADKNFIRRASIDCRPGGRWGFEVSEISEHGIILVAKQPEACVTTQPTQCMHAADLAACAVYGREKVSVSASSVNECQ